MKAIIWKRYGGPEHLELQEVADPVPGDREVRIRVHAASVTMGDCEVRTLTFRFPLSLLMRAYVGLVRPKRIRILGQEVAGVIDAVGAGVTEYRVGDEVFAETDFSMGGCAELICLAATPDEAEVLLAPKPSNLTFEQAAAVPLGGVEALKYLDEARVQAGERVLIVGSGGSIGTMAIQLAKHAGAEVTAVDAGEKLAMMRSTGADHVVDYAVDDVTRGAERYDVVFDVVGKSAPRKLLSILAPGGRLILANPTFAAMIRGARTTRDGTRIIVGLTGTPDHLRRLVELIEAGALSPVVDRTYSLADVPEAHRYVESGRKQGSVVVTVVPRSAGA